MNILHISSARSWRGGEQQIAFLIEGLNNLGITNHILAPKYSPLAQYPFGDSVHIHTYKKLSSFNPIVSFTLKSIAEKHNIDLIHIHDSHSHNYFITAHALGMKINAFLSRRVDFIPSSKSKYNHRGIAKIICVSNYVASILAPIVKNNSKLCTVHDGVDLTKKGKPITSLRKLLNIDPETKIIANISALADHKDYPTFVSTASAFLKKHKEKSVFVIVGGDAGEMENVRALIAAENLEKNILLTGWIQNAHQLLNEVDVFLFTSKEEGLGSTLLDAMLYGIPIVSTKAGGIPEVIKHYHNGLLCNIGDIECLSQGIIEVLDNKTLQKTLISNGLERVKLFSKERMASETLKVYQETISHIK